MGLLSILKYNSAIWSIDESPRSLPISQFSVEILYTIDSINFFPSSITMSSVLIETN